MKYFLALLLFVSSFAEARTPLGSFTTGKLSLYKVVARDNPGWADDSVSSYNYNFDILASTINALINGTLAEATSNYVLNRSTQPGFTETRLNKLVVVDSVTLPTGYLLPVEDISPGSTHYIQARDTIQSGATAFPELLRASSATVTDFNASVSSVTDRINLRNDKPIGWGDNSIRIEGDTTDGTLRVFHSGAERLTITAPSAFGWYDSSPDVGFDIATTTLLDENYRVEGGSVAYLVVTTVTLPSGSIITNMNPQTCNTFQFFDPDWSVILDSSPVTIPTGFAPFTVPGATALDKYAFIKARIIATQDAVAESFIITANARKVGSSNGVGSNNEIAGDNANLATQVSRDAGTAWVPLVNGQVDLQCRIVGTANTQNCLFGVMALCR